jgi:hypothetical protein
MDPTGMAPDDIYSYEGKEVARLKNGQPDRTFDVKPGEGGWEVQRETTNFLGNFPIQPDNGVGF